LGSASPTAEALSTALAALPRLGPDDHVQVYQEIEQGIEPLSDFVCVPLRKGYVDIGVI
jgi:hypothetical protein